MPSSTPERQARWQDDYTACRFLEQRGFRLLAGWSWVAPAGHVMTDDEQDAVIYLIEEWDYGGVERDGYEPKPGEVRPPLPERADLTDKE